MATVLRPQRHALRPDYHSQADMKVLNVFASQQGQKNIVQLNDEEFSSSSGESDGTDLSQLPSKHNCLYKELASRVKSSTFIQESRSSLLC